LWNLSLVFAVDTRESDFGNEQKGTDGGSKNYHSDPSGSKYEGVGSETGNPHDPSGSGYDSPNQKYSPSQNDGTSSDPSIDRDTDKADPEHSKKRSNVKKRNKKGKKHDKKGAQSENAEEDGSSDSKKKLSKKKHEEKSEVNDESEEGKGAKKSKKKRDNKKKRDEQSNVEGGDSANLNHSPSEESKVSESESKNDEKKAKGKKGKISKEKKHKKSKKKLKKKDNTDDEENEKTEHGDEDDAIDEEKTNDEDSDGDGVDPSKTLELIDSKITKNCTYIDLHGITLSDDSLTYITERILQMKLTDITLVFSGCTFTKDLVAKLWAFLCEHPGLAVCLDLSKTGLTDEFASTIISPPQSKDDESGVDFPVKRLILSDNKLTDKFVENLVRFVTKYRPCITMLDISGNWIGDLSYHWLSNLSINSIPFFKEGILIHNSYFSKSVEAELNNGGKVRVSEKVQDVQESTNHLPIPAAQPNNVAQSVHGPQNIAQIAQPVQTAQAAPVGQNAQISQTAQNPYVPNPMSAQNSYPNTYGPQSGYAADQGRPVAPNKNESSQKAAWGNSPHEVSNPYEAREYVRS
jgi:hypothetical protein